MSDQDQEKVESTNAAFASFEGEPLSTDGGIAKRRIWQKLDTHLLPLLIFLYFLSFFCKQSASPFLISIATIGGAFGGIFAYGIEHLDGKAGLRGWQWIFFVEGLTTVVVAILSYLFIHDYPETAKFLTEEERQFVIQTLADDSKGQATHFSKKFVWQALADWKTYAQAVNFMWYDATSKPFIVPLDAFTTWASLLQMLSYYRSHLSFSAGLSTYIISIWSDRVNLRGPFIVTGAMVSMTGYITAYMTNKPGPGYVAAIIAACGAFPGIAISLAWAGGNAGGNVKRGIVLAVVIGLGNTGGVCSSFIYYQPPRFYKGHGTMMGCLGMSIICSCIMMWTYKRLNEAKEEQCAREGINESMKDMYRDLADKSPLFRYVI
ncbi:major facilitator superfamily domain-containing protein [Lactarius psammicola]|nr:major facilitator superfamily domain-containing protein [Lactarius psammicola]